MYQPAAESGQDNSNGPPAFRMVWRGYDREEVDAYLPQLTARLREAVDRHAEAEQAKAELQREVTSLREGSFQQLGGEATALLQEAGRSAEQLVENARRHAETIIEKAQQQAEQVRADGTNEAQKALAQAREVADQIHREAEQERAALHGEISTLLERIGTRRDQPLTAGADPKAATPPNAEAEKPPKPPRQVPERAKVAEPD